MVEEFRKRLCMSELIVYYSHHQSELFCDNSSGKIDPSIAFIESGSVTMSIGGKKVTLGKNSLYYMPDGIRYTSLWHGEPDICYFDLHVVSNRPDKTNAQRYAMTHKKELSTPETGKRVREIYELFRSGERTDKVRGVGLYYLLYADIIPYLSPEPPARRKPALDEAIAFTEQNLAEDFSVDDMAAHCHVSASRLYHLFRDELATTPVRFRNEMRVERAAEELRRTDRTIDEIAGRCGYNSPAYFREIFREITGMTPAEYRGSVTQ